MNRQACFKSDFIPHANDIPRKPAMMTPVEAITTVEVRIEDEDDIVKMIK